MIAQQDYQPTSGAGFGQNRFKHADVLRGPDSVDLIALIQIIVHRIDHDANHSLLFIRQRLANITSETRIFIALQRGLVEQLWRKARL